MTIPPPHKLRAWANAAERDSFTKPHASAEHRLAEAMAAHAPGMTWHELFGRGPRALLRGPRVSGRFDTLPPIRAAVWSHMRREPNPPSYPEIARACGLRSHSTIVMAVRRFRCKVVNNGGSK